MLAACGHVGESGREVGEAPVALGIEAGGRADDERLDAHVRSAVEDVREVQPTAGRRQFEVQIAVGEPDDEAVLEAVVEASSHLLEPAVGKGLRPLLRSRKGVRLDQHVLRRGPCHDASEPAERARVAQARQEFVAHCC